MIADTNRQAAPTTFPAMDTPRIEITRGELLTLLFIVVCANSLLPTVVTGIVRDGLLYSVSNTFEISAIVWGALVIGSSFALRQPGSARPTDMFAAASILIGCLLPLGPATWVLATALGFYAIFTSDIVGDWQHRAGWIFVAITVPMFWSKRIFNLFAHIFLAIDATLVSSITHTERIDNLVAMPGGEGYLQIAAPCSSMANVSLAILCWILFTQTQGMRWRLSNVLWCIAACVSVVAINVTRISLIGFFPQKYELIHGPIGATIVSWITIFTVFGVCYFGVGRGRFKIV